MDKINLNIVQTEFAKTWMEDGILFQEMNEGIKTVTLEIAHSLIQSRYQIAGENDVIAIFIANNALSVDDEAKSFIKQILPISIL